MDFDTKNPNLGYPSQIFFLCVCKNSILKETFNVKKNFWEFVILRILCLNVQMWKVFLTKNGLFWTACKK